MNDLSKADIISILEASRKMQRKAKPSLLKGHVMAVLFFEPSTRTRLSFESAMRQLGGSVISMAEAGISSASKGESLSDGVRVVSSYTDVIVIRHPLQGSARLASESASVPVINAGDGANQHPTQTLLDLYTIKQSQGKLTGLNVAMVGDLKYGRTVHSLAAALAKFGCRMHFISPESLRMPANITGELDAHKIRYEEHSNLGESLSDVDILYSTRIQKERFADVKEYESVKNSFILDKSMFRGVKNNFKILHPLPRVNEISTNIDDQPYAHYFQQAANGIPVRQALLGLLMGKLR